MNIYVDCTAVIVVLFTYVHVRYNDREYAYSSAHP